MNQNIWTKTHNFLRSGQFNNTEWTMMSRQAFNKTVPASTMAHHIRPFLLTRFVPNEMMEKSSSQICESVSKSTSVANLRALSRYLSSLHSIGWKSTSDASQLWVSMVDKMIDQQEFSIDDQLALLSSAINQATYTDRLGRRVRSLYTSTAIAIDKQRVPESAKQNPVALANLMRQWSQFFDICHQMLVKEAAINIVINDKSLLPPEVQPWSPLPPIEKEKLYSLDKPIMQPWMLLSHEDLVKNSRPRVDEAGSIFSKVKGGDAKEAELSGTFTPSGSWCFDELPLLYGRLAVSRPDLTRLDDLVLTLDALRMLPVHPASLNYVLSAIKSAIVHGQPSDLSPSIPPLYRPYPYFPAAKSRDSNGSQQENHDLIGNKYAPRVMSMVRAMVLNEVRTPQLWRTFDNSWKKVKWGHSGAASLFEIYGDIARLRTVQRRLALHSRLFKLEPSFRSVVESIDLNVNRSAFPFSSGDFLPGSEYTTSRSRLVKRSVMQRSRVLGDTGDATQEEDEEQMSVVNSKGMATGTNGFLQTTNYRIRQRSGLFPARGQSRRAVLMQPIEEDFVLHTLGGEKNTGDWYHAILPVLPVPSHDVAKRIMDKRLIDEAIWLRDDVNVNFGKIWGAVFVPKEVKLERGSLVDVLVGKHASVHVGFTCRAYADPEHEDLKVPIRRGAYEKTSNIHLPSDFDANAIIEGKYVCKDERFLVKSEGELDETADEGSHEEESGANDLDELTAPSKPVVKPEEK
eukprot:GDKJ01029598.1.p1 GENE.GDKJ01029598.1~~GDKJ01029598.1.p1  ORF type:complete len:742 (+),score=173.75 GDKJ01029598.1:113-2338(+)